jgi:NADH-quinone oxidoreductase subunit M
MLLSILGLVFLHRREAGVYSFDYFDLLGTPTGGAALWLLLGFFLAFAVKLPAVPLHTWLPDAHTEAPTAGSVILAGLLLKTGAYGLLRFAVPLFPDAAETVAPVAMVLGAVGVLYGALQAFAQTDLKRLVAYSSVSHLGFVLLGIFAWNLLALQGAVMTMICHGLSTGALFVLVGQIKERVHSRDLKDMGGFAAVAPRMAALAMFFAMASLGLPGLGNFVGEMLVLIGSFQATVWITAAAAVGLVGATVYSLWIVQQSFHGPIAEGRRIADVTPRELVVLGSMVVALVWLGLYPQPVLETARPALESLRDLAAASHVLAAR